VWESRTLPGFFMDEARDFAGFVLLCRCSMRLAR
jgi:hypothetical protein